MRAIVARAIHSVLSRPIPAKLLVDAASDRLAVFMLHRFATTSNRTSGHSPSTLGATLELLRRSGVRFLSLDDAVAEYVGRATSRRTSRPSVAFTVDDGYRDFMDVGLPVFEAFRCPVTCFVVPDVIDGKSWFWWDRLDFLLRRLPTDQLTLEIDGERFDVRRSTHEYSWQRPVVAMLKGRGEGFRASFLAELEKVSNVAHPTDVPEEYRVMTWDAIRSCELRGARFGAHSLSHPVLSQVSRECAAREISGSVERLQAELQNPSSVFCYPYGLASDFGSREVELLRAAGVSYAVSALPGTVRLHAGRIAAGGEYSWRIPRFAFDGRPAISLLQLLFS